MTSTLVDRRTQLYHSILRIRLVEESIAERYAEQEMRCPVHLSIGQEAVAVGVCASLEIDDYVISGHRAHAHYLAKGGSLKRMLAEIYGKDSGCSRGKGGSMHLIDQSVGFLGSTPIVGGSLPIGVGSAWGSHLKGESKVSTVFFGEGATEEGVFAESLNFAALHKLPIVFVCENNLYSVYSPMEPRQPPTRSRTAIAEAHGIPSELVDGNKLDLIEAASREACDRARRGDGPSYLEFETYRWREHCGPNYDNDLGYRRREEFEEWKQRCPVAYWERRLFNDGALDLSYRAHLYDAIDDEINAAFAFAESSPWPDPENLHSDVYKER